LIISTMSVFPQLTLVCTASALIAGCGQSSGDPHPQQLLSKRIAIFKKFTKTLEPMGLVARDRRDYVKADFVEQAKTLQELSTQPWAYFSAEGNYAPTRAKPEIWSQPDKFKGAQERFLASVNHLAQVADSADMPTIRSAVDEVQRNCKACHDQFRSDTVVGR